MHGLAEDPKGPSVNHPRRDLALRDAHPQVHAVGQQRVDTPLDPHRHVHGDRRRQGGLVMLDHPRPVDHQKHAVPRELVDVHVRVERNHLVERLPVQVRQHVRHLAPVGMRRHELRARTEVHQHARDVRVVLELDGRPVPLPDVLAVRGDVPLTRRRDR
eukprot:8497071-Pyramimonas_sp.AAC.1